MSHHFPDVLSPSRRLCAGDKIMPGDCVTINGFIPTDDHNFAVHECSEFNTHSASIACESDVNSPVIDTNNTDVDTHDTPPSIHQSPTSFWHARFTIEHAAMLRAFRADDLAYALRSVRHYFRAQAMAIGFASKDESRGVLL